MPPPSAAPSKEEPASTLAGTTDKGTLQVGGGKHKKYLGRFFRADPPPPLLLRPPLIQVRGVL